MADRHLRYTAKHIISRLGSAPPSSLGAFLHSGYHNFLAIISKLNYALNIHRTVRYSATMMPNTTASTPALQLATIALPLSLGFFVGVALLALDPVPVASVVD